MTSAEGLLIVVMFAKGQFTLADDRLSWYRADSSAARYHTQLHTELGWPLKNCPARPIWELSEGEKPEFMRTDSAFLEWIKKGQK